MSLFYEAARSYLAEAGDEHLDAEHDTEYAMLGPEDRNRFDAHVENQAVHLVYALRKAAEAFMVDATPFTPAPGCERCGRPT